MNYLQKLWKQTPNSQVKGILDILWQIHGSDVYHSQAQGVARCQEMYAHRP